MSRLLVESLIAVGVQEVFYLPGAHVDGLLRAMLEDGRLRCFMATHEAGAAFMADGVCRMYGRPSVVLTIGGPGAGNMITAALTAATDRVPIIYITGDAPSFLDQYGAFQQTGPGGTLIRTIFEAAGCRSFRIADALSFQQAFSWYRQQQVSGKQRPLHLSIPCDMAGISVPRYHEIETSNGPGSAEKVYLHEKRAVAQIGKKPRKAALWIGKDISPTALNAWKLITAQYRIPVIATMESAGQLADFEETLFIGVFGYAGHPEAYDLICDPTLDLLILHGVEFNERNTTLWSASIWHPDRRVMIIGTEPSIYWPAPLELETSIHASVSDAMKIIIQACPAIEFEVIPDHESKNPASSVTHHRYVSEDALMDDNDTTLTLAWVLQRICYSLPEDMHVFTDAGDHRYFTSFIFSRKPHRHLYGASQTAPMGWAIGAGIGAGLSRPQMRTLVITGDGCMLMHGMETSTAVRYQVPVTFLIVDNGSYGKISRRFSDIGDTGADHPGFLAEVDWSIFCRALSMPFAIVSEMQELMPSWEASMNSPGPFVIILKVGPDEPYPNPASVFSSTDPSFIKECQQHIKTTGWPIKNIPS